MYSCRLPAGDVASTIDVVGASYFFFANDHAQVIDITDRKDLRAYKCKLLSPSEEDRAKLMLTLTLLNARSYQDSVATKLSAPARSESKKDA